MENVGCSVKSKVRVQLWEKVRGIVLAQLIDHVNWKLINQLSDQVGDEVGEQIWSQSTNGVKHNIKL